MAHFAIETLSQGILYGILAVGVLLTYRILDFADLSVDGTAPLGGVVAAMVIVHFQQPLGALLAAFIAGMIAGMITGILHVKLNISALLSGIIMMTGLYSINRNIGDSSNIPLYNYTTIFSSGWVIDLFDPASSRIIASLYQLVVLLIVVIIIKVLIDWLLSTQFGFLIKITGNNPQLVSSLGENIGRVKIIALGISNGLAALYGGVAVQFLGYYDITMGSGVIAAGLASVILGTALLGRFARIRLTSMVVVGAFAYRLTIALSYRFNAPTSFEKLVTVFIVIFALSVNNGALKSLFKRGEHHD